MAPVEKYKLEIFIPESHLEPLRQALHEAGAGQTNKYDYCLHVSTISSAWRPLAGAAPYQGSSGRLEQREECKVELFCLAANVAAALRAIRRVHPYEEAGVNVIPLFNHLFE